MASTIATVILPRSAQAAACVPPAGTYRFDISVSGLGQVGSLVGVVKTEAGRTSIDVKSRIIVRIAGIVVHRYVETRKTEWRDGKLVSYRAQARSNGKPETTTVTRTANGSLRANRNGKTSTLPGDAIPGFPWASCITGQKRIFGLRSLKVSPLIANLSAPQSIRLGDSDLPAREVKFKSPADWRAWFAEDGSLLRHSFRTNGRRVTLIRTRPSE